jgi:hypothetical protein
LVTLLEDARTRLCLSKSYIADLIGVCPSTLSRSVAANALSADLEKRIRDLLRNGIAPLAARAKGRVISESEFLLLQEFASMMPSVQKLIKTILDRPSSAAKESV